MKTENSLKVAIALCVLFSLLNAAGIIHSHTPPYSVGECISMGQQRAIAKIEFNDIIGGYSELSMTSSGETQNGPMAFVEMRSRSFKPVECPK